MFLRRIVSNYLNFVADFLMKILYLSSSKTMNLADRRGYSTHIIEMLQAFQENGNDVLPIVAGAAAPAGLSVNNTISVKDKIRKYMPGSFVENIRILYDLYYNTRYYFRIKDAVQTFNPDFIYERYLLYHHAGTILSKKYNVPIILEFNSPITERNVHYGYRSRTLARRVEKKALMSGDAIVVVSGYLKKYLLDSGIEDGKIHVIPNAVNCDRFRPEIDGLLLKKKYGIMDKIVVGFVGGFSLWHGIDTLLEAAVEIIQEIKNIHFLLVGEGNMLNTSEKFVRDNGISEYVTFSGSIPYENIPQYIAAMDITTMPSSNKYGSPIKIFEYMAMQKPVIAPNIEPVQEVITKDREGLLITPGDKRELRDAIIYLCTHAKSAIQMAERAHQKVLKNYTWQRNAEKIVQLALSLRS